MRIRSVSKSTITIESLSSHIEKHCLSFIETIVLVSSLINDLSLNSFNASFVSGLLEEAEKKILLAETSPIELQANKDVKFFLGVKNSLINHSVEGNLDRTHRLFGVLENVRDASKDIPKWLPKLNNIANIHKYSEGENLIKKIDGIEKICWITLKNINLILNSLKLLHTPKFPNRPVVKLPENSSEV